jgi:streptogramin lyase
MMLRKLIGALILPLVLVASAIAKIPGTGTLDGTVTAPKPFTAAKVFARKAGSNITYVVFTEGGHYSAVNVMPGQYEVWAEHQGFTSDRASVTVAEDKASQAAITMAVSEPVRNPVGPRGLEDRWLVPFDELYPPGETRDLLRDTCIVCHAWNFLPAQPQSRAGWGAVVDYMTTSPHWGVPDSDPFLVPERLPLAKREMLLDYLEANFGDGQPPRAVLEEETEPRDESVLGKAQYIMYTFPKTDDAPNIMRQEITFDSKGNVWSTDTRRSAISFLNPKTGEHEYYLTPHSSWAPHGIAIDTDDTIWFAALKVGAVHFDPETGNWDAYGKDEDSHRDMGGLTPFLDSKGNVYWTDIRFNKIGRLDRATGTWTHFDSPTMNGSPYGGVVDRQDRFWWNEFHACGVAVYDPKTGTTKAYPSPSRPCLSRRPGLDSKGNIWYGVYDRGRLEKLDPATGVTTVFQIPVKFATPYDTWVDPDDKVWTSSDNYFVRLDPDNGSFTYYPTPWRNDMPKMTIARGGAIWFPARGDANSPAALGVLWPDKADMDTFNGNFPPNDPNATVLRGGPPPIAVAGNANDGGQWPKPPGTEYINPELGAAAE